MSNNQLSKITRLSKLASMNKIQKREGTPKHPNYKLKLGIWIYFFLLIFEGALRKWFLPSLTTPLLLVRDPVAIWLLIVSFRRNLLSFNIYMVGMIVLGLAGIFTAVLFGHGNFFVAIYGARILVIYFPLIFVIGRIFNRDDVIKMGRATLMISIPMAILIAIQFYSPQSAWVNRSVNGGDEGAGFSGALGYYRPPGTFSFTNGNALFFGFVTPFILFFWFNPKEINKIILIAATISLLCAIPFSISRTLFYRVAVSVVFAILAISRKPAYLGKMLLIFITVTVSIVVLSNAPFFQKATFIFGTRFERASNSEGGVDGTLRDRYLGGMLEGITNSADQPFWGAGLGIGTSVGSKLQSGTTGLHLGEDEWQRIMGEMGFIMGIAVIFFRVGAFIKFSLAAYKKLASGDLLPWMLLSICLVTLPQGIWGQPTSLGFGILIAGLTLGSLRTPVKANHSAKAKDAVQRGRRVKVAKMPVKQGVV